MDMKRVTLRFKKSRGDKTYLFLDYYPPILDPRTNTRKRQEYLGMYIYTHPKDGIQREYNNRILKHAKLIEAKRSLAAIDRDLGRFDYRNLDADFLRYFEIKSQSRSATWRKTYEYFYNFVNGTCRFYDLNFKCREFYSYLLNCNAVGKKMTLKSADYYFDCFKDILAEAYQDGYLLDNLCRELNR